MKMPNENVIFILNLLQNGVDSARELQLTALEQLCSLLLQTDNAEILKREFPPSSFIPVLTKIFVDWESPPVILESAARVLTYYLQILPLESSSCLFESEGALCAICLYLESSNLENTIENDLAQQIIKMLEELVRRDSNVLKLTNCIPSVFEFISNSWKFIHLDTLRSGLFVAGRIASFLDLWLKNEIEVISGSPQLSTTSPPPQLFRLQRWIASLVKLISHRDLQVSCSGLDCLHVIITACRRLPISWSVISQLTSENNLVETFLSLLSSPEPAVTNSQGIKCNERTTMSKTATTEMQDTANVAQDGERQVCGTSDAACNNLMNHRTCLTGPLATIVVDLILNLCQGQTNLLSSIAQSPALARLFQHGLFDYSVGKNDATATKALNSNLDGLVPTLQLADGLLTLAMTLPCRIGQNQMNPEFTQPSTNGAVHVKYEQGTGTLQNQLEKVEKHDKLLPLVGDQDRIMWKNCLKARLVSPGHNDPVAAYMRSDLPAPPSLTSSSSSVTSTSRQLNEQIPQAAFFAARQALDHLGISDEIKVASERFHQWLANSLANRANMADILSILQSGQINGCWMDSVGQPLLAWSLSTGHGAATLALCNRGADVNAGLTASAIHYAIAYGQYQCVRRLLGCSLSPDDNQILTEANAANPRLRDYQGRTPAQLGLQALASAIERGTGVEQSLNHARLLQEAEDKFKMEVDENVASPFANLLKLTLPVLTEIYTNSTRPEIKLRALQIIARSVRSKTGFVVLYQMQKCSETRSTDGNISASNSRGIPMCNRLVQIIAHVLSQGSAEEVFIALTTIPALIDQPYFLTWMHRHGIPDLLAWRSKLYEQEISGQVNSKDENDIVGKKLVEVPNSPAKISVREILPMCIPPYVKKPQIISLEPEETISSFQCLYELGQQQAYNMGDWYIMRTDLNSLLLFHEFAILWLEVSPKLKLTTKTTETSVASSRAVAAEEETVTAHSAHHTINAYLITRKDKCAKSDVVVVTPLLPVGQNSSAVSATEDSGQLSKPSSLYFPNSSEAVENLTVRHFRPNSSPVDKSELANDLWRKLLPIIVQIRHMFYGMLPLPIFKSASPTSGSRKTNKTKQINHSKSPVKAPELQVPGCSTTTHDRTSPEMSNTSSPGCLISRTCATSSSIGGHQSEDICAVKEIRNLCVIQTDVSNRVTSSPVETRQAEQQSHVPYTAENLKDKFEPETSTNYLVVSDPPRLTNSQLSSGSPHDAPLSSANEITVDQSDATHQHMRVELPDLGGSFSSEVTGKATLGLSQSMPTTSSDFVNQHFVAEMTKDEQNKTEQIYTSVGREAEPEPPDYNNGLSASGKVISLHVGPIRLSLSPQGLWILIEPKADTKVHLPTTEGGYFDVCVHPECESRWNPDCSDDVMDYNGKTVQFSDKTGGLPSQRSRAPNHDARNSPRTAETDFSVTGGAQDSKYETIKILCHPTRLGGIRVYDELDKLIYQTGPIARSSGNLRLTRLLDNLSFNQKQYVRTKHRENRLKNIQQTIIRVALALSNLLKRLMSKKLISQARKLSSPLFEKHLLNHESGMFLQLTAFTDWFRSANLPTATGANRRNSSLDLSHLIERFHHATPYEILASEIIPQMYIWLKQKMERERFRRYVWRHIYDWNESKICEDEQSRLDGILIGMNLEVLTKKLIETLELIERYRMPLTQFVNLPEQLLTRTIQLRPMLVDHPREETSGTSVPDRSAYCRKVDLTSYHLYVQPLATVRQLQKWILKTAKKIPWYNDELKHMGFVYDLKRPPNRVCLVPPETSVGNALTTEHNIFWGGVFAWLGTNGGRESKWANPLRLHGLVRMISSDSQLNADPYTLGVVLANPTITSQRARHTLGTARTAPRIDDTHSSVWIRPSETESFTNYSTAWIAFDLGVHIYLTHYMIQVPMLSDHWPELTDWQLQGSTNGITWTVLSEHHITLVGHPKFYWGNDGERLWELASTSCLNGSAEVRSWRFFRLQLLPSNGRCEANGVTLSRANSLPLRGIEFFGTVTKVFIKPDKEAQNEAYAYLGQLRSGTFVVPALPLPICGRNSYSSADKIHHERWPHLNLTEQGTSSQMASHETDGRTSTKDSTGIPSEPPLLGKVVRDLTDGYVSVQWLTGYADQLFSFRSQKHQSSTVYAMGANQRFDLRIPSEEEVRLRLKILRESDRVKQDAENPVSSSSAMYECAANEEVSVSTPGTGVKGGQDDLNERPPNEQSSDCALVPTHQSLTSYLLPMSQNWLADALLPTFNRVLPFLFTSYSPQLMRDPPVLKPRLSSQMVTVTSQPHPSSSLQAGTTQATTSNWKDRRSVLAGNVAMDSEELLLPETRICNGPITGPDITDHSVKLQTPVCRDHDIPETTDSSTNRCLITVKSRSNSACSSTAAHVPETLDLPENLLILPRCKISGSDDELQEMEGQIELECDSDDRDEEDELNQIDEKAGICDDHGGAQTSQTTTRMNYRPRHEDQFDAALEAIGRTLELRVLANAKEAGVRTSCPLDDDEAVTRAPKRASRRKFAKFDQWERKDPICVQTIIQQCMNLCVVSAPDATQSAAPCYSQIAHQPRDPTASSCSQLQMDGEVSSVQPPDRLSTGINMLGGGVSSNETDEQCLYQKAIVKTDQCADTLVLPLVSPSTAPAHPPRDLKTVPRNRPTNKPILRSQCCDGIKMETIESNLDGLIPPFETRSGTSHLPSTVSFSIPARIPWPPAGLSPVDKPTTRNIDSVSSKTHVRLWLHQEQNSDAMLNPLGASSFSTLSPTSSGSTSFCSTATTKPGTPCPVTFGPTLPEVPVDPANTHQMVKFSLDKPEINLIYYLLRFMDYKEEFLGSGVLRPTGWQLSRMWNRTYLLDYQLESSGSIANVREKTVNLQPTFPKTTELSHPPFADEGLLDQLLDLIGLLHEFVSYRTKSPCDLQSNSVSCEWKSVGGLMEKRCDPSTSEIAHISDFGCDAFPSQQVITVPYSIDESSFHSTRLTRKLMLYANDVWSILASSHLLSNPDFQTSDCDQVLSWVPRFVMQYKFLFPFEARLEFWRVSSLGASRAIAWLQKQAGNARVSSNQQTFVTNMPSFLQRMEASSNALRDRGGFKSFGCDFSWTPSVLVVPNKDNTRSEWCANVYCDAARTGNTGNWFSFGVPPPPNLSVVTPGIGVGTSGAGFIQSTLTSLGRLQRHTTRVPRPRTANNPPERETEITTNGVEQIIVNDHPYTFFSGGNDFWSTTVRLLLVHADKHQELEVEFEGEEGTGLGPTMEFYALLSAELRRHSHGLWVSEDRAERKNQARDLIDDPNKNCMSDDWDPVLLADYAEVDTVNTTVCRTKLTQEEADCDTDLTDIEDDFYVNPPFGLFPAPWPANQLPPGTELRFYVLGIAVAKCLVDQRQMDLPFSNAFLTLLCKVVGDGERYCQNEFVARSSTDWPAGVLDLLHFTEIYPERGKFVNNLIYYLRERDALKNERSECDLEAADVDLQKRIFSAELRALYIDMCFPSVTRKFGQNDFPLTKDYEPEMIELDRPTQQPEDNEELLIPSTAEAYVRRSLEFALNKGIRRQLHAFKAGFERVAPLSSLSMFTPQELGRLISGESCPNWNTTEIWANCEPAAGYNRQSKGFLLLIEGLASFDAIERRKFLRFVTGCPTLPPGGLRNLHPKLKVAKKDGSTCGPYPSVNTCMHYLKLPEYETVNELKQYLLAAASQTGFYLN